MGTLAVRRLDGVLAEKGLGTIGTTGLRVLERVILDPAPQVGVIPVRWSTFLGRSPAGRRPLFAELGDEAPPDPAATSPTEAGSLGDRLRESTPEARLALLGDYLLGQVSRVLGIGDDRLGPGQPFHQFGLDSLMAVEIKHQLKRDVGVDVPARAVSSTT